MNVILGALMTDSRPTSTRPTITRFAPSPTGELHLGNARTALFNWLLAHRDGGQFLLRIEDTDAERSRPEYTAQLQQDLRWLGLEWDEPVVHQSTRGVEYRAALEQLAQAGRVYPCFCSTLEIELSRKAQLAAGRPPRYAGTCRHLTEAERAKKLAEGRKPTLRFRVPDDGEVRFTDLVHGEQMFRCADIGDFIVQRADGSAAFFFSNILDDAAMGITTVLRGEDHLSNTPRQLLIAMALGLRAPDYGHLSLITGSDGGPLSKRQGAKSLRELREAGYLPQALVNQLYRLGHSTDLQGLQSLEVLAKHFNTSHFVRSAARFDDAQLAMWQKEAVHALTPTEALAWLRKALPADLSGDTAAAFVQAVQANVILPQEAADWARIVLGPPPVLEGESASIVREAGAEFHAAAVSALDAHGADWQALVTFVKAQTGRKGPALFKPLRLALTGLDHGPELAPLMPLIGVGRARERFARFVGSAASESRT